MLIDSLGNLADCVEAALNRHVQPDYHFGWAETRIAAELSM
jgi:hypothetical protein